jgi:hypothetical protein
VSIVTREGERIAIASIALDNFDWMHPSAPRFAEIAISGADLPLGALAEAARLPAVPSGDTRRLLNRAGYGRTTGDLHLAYRYREDRRELEIRENRLEIADLGVLSLDLTLGNVPTPEAGQAFWPALTQVSLVGATVAFRDRSLVSRLVQAYAAEKGLSAAEAHAALVRDVRDMRDREPDRLRREALAALLSFVERPGELAVRIEPPRPLTLFDFLLGSSSNLKERLGARIAAR